VRAFTTCGFGVPKRTPATAWDDSTGVAVFPLATAANAHAATAASAAPVHLAPIWVL
jgi:hypothetical protein